jgi:dihydrofolate reductase
MKNIQIIAAIGLNNELGKDNDLLWHIPEDLKQFKKITSGHTVIMGRKTFNSINNKPLPNRRNIVITSDATLNFPGIEVAHSVEEAIEHIKPKEKVFILGGATIYRQFLPVTVKIYLTRVYKAYEADTFFPEVNWSDWQEVEKREVKNDEKAGVDYTFFTYERKL